ncbi:MAG TPA: ATP-binding protein [Pseudonocardia sp.]|nr:ATP-binding protein [Pseudonocardia sp.]
MHRSWPAYPRHLAALRAEVRRWLAPLALPGDAKNDLLLAVNEAGSNCIEHAYAPAIVDGTVELTFWTEPEVSASRSSITVGGGLPAVSPPGAVGGSRSCSGSSRWS